MNKQRAKEIADSPMMKHVTYQECQFISSMWMKKMKPPESIV